MYTDKVIKHFRYPKNYGRIKNPDGIGKVGNVVCGDVMWLYIKVAINKRKQEIISDIKFETFGCVAAIATSNMIADLAKNQPLNRALEISKEKIVKSLGGLPPVKLHCSVLAADALSEAIYDYYSKNKRQIAADLLKRHQRIMKEREIIEEKYKDWVDTEEKMHQHG